MTRARSSVSNAAGLQAAGRSAAATWPCPRSRLTFPICCSGGRSFGQWMQIGFAFTFAADYFRTSSRCFLFFWMASKGPVILHASSPD